MYICLMRHGKAEPFQEGRADQDRELTAKGKKQSVMMADLALRWWPEGKTSLWASPYVRACQTAAFLEQTLDIETFHTHPAIAEGNLQGLYEEILCKEKADIVCIVGHSPYLDQWAVKWTGTAVDFKTGSMALFEYDPYSGNEGSASLVLYLHPKAALFMK